MSKDKQSFSVLPGLLFLLALGAGSRIAWHGLDFASVLLFSVWIIFTWRFSRHSRQQENTSPLPAVCIPAVVILGLTAATWNSSGTGMSGLRQLTQVFLLLGCGVSAGAWLRREPQLQEYFAGGICAALAVNLLLGLLQLSVPGFGTGLAAALFGAAGAPMFGPDLTEELATGLLPSHSLYCAFSCLAAPFMLELLRKFRRGAGCVLSQFCFLLLLSQTFFYGPFIIILAVTVLVYFCRPRNIQNKPAKNFAWLAALIILLLTALAFNKPLVRQPEAVSLPLSTMQPFNDFAGHERQPKRLFTETAAVIGTASGNWLGTGPGTYREAVRRARVQAELPRPLEDRVRRDSNSQYIVFLLEYGWPATACLLLLLGWALLKSLAAAQVEDESDTDNSLAEILPSALTALVMSGAFTMFFSRGPGPLAAILIGAAVAGAGSGASIACSCRCLPLRRRLPLQAVFVVLALLLLPLFLPSAAVNPRSPQTDAIRRPAPKSADLGTAAVAVAAAGHGSITSSAYGMFFLEAEDFTAKSEDVVISEGLDMGLNRCTSIPESAAQGKAVLSYRLRPPQPGTYKLWLRVFWDGACSNSINCQLDNGRQFTVEDGIFQRWHWVDISDGHVFELSAEHEFRLISTEGGVHVDQIAFFADPRARPAGILTVIQALKPVQDQDQDPAPQNLFESEAMPAEDGFE